MLKLMKTICITTLMLGMLNMRHATANVLKQIEDLRDSLEKKGIALETVFTIDYMANTKGGLYVSLKLRP